MTLVGSNSCLVLPGMGGNRWSRKIAEAAVNAKNLTNPVGMLGAEVANPWRAGCSETGTSGSEGGVGKRAESNAPCAYPTES